MDLASHFSGIVQRDGQSNNEGQLVKNLDVPGAIQAFNNVHVSGNMNVVGRDLHVHHHHYQLDDAAIPLLLRDVPNLRNIQMATLGKATAGTGDWIYFWEEFAVWLASDGHIRILWGSGMPGAGKTVLSSLAINALEARAQASETPICVGFLYIRYSDQSRLTVRNLLEILVKQTIERHPQAFTICDEAYRRHIRERTEPSTQELVSLLKRFTTEVAPTTFYFLDALDEAPVNVQIDLLESLTSLNAKLFITSRPLKALQARFPGAHHFPIVAHDRDLDVHIGKEISRSAEIQAILSDSSPGLEGRITLRVKRKCAGMFLHASLQLKALTECTSRYDLEKTLDEFPPEIDDVYVQTWSRITSQPLGRSTAAIGVLTWVVYATRSLTINELRHAMARSPTTHQFEPRKLTSIETLVSACCGLVNVEHETNSVRLVHYSAKPSLDDLIPSVVPHPQSQLAAICMAHLAEAGLQQSSIESSEALESALMASPLLRYSYHSWAAHVRGSLGDESLRERASRFVQSCITFPILPRKHGKLGRFGPLHVAAFFDLPLSLAGANYVRNINVPTQAEGMTPLHLASVGNTQLSVKELLTIPKIQVNAGDKEGWTPLVWASELGNDEAMEILLADNRVKVNEPSVVGFTALHRAAQNGRTGAVRLLLSHPKIKVNQTDRFSGTPLILAAFLSKTEAVKALLGHRQINPNMLDQEGMSALMRALSPGLGDGVEVVRALVAHPQTDVNQRHKDGWTPLQWARRYNLKEIEEILLSNPRTIDPMSPKVNSPRQAGGSSVSRLADGLSRLTLPFGER